MRRPRGSASLFDGRQGRGLSHEFNTMSNAVAGCLKGNDSGTPRVRMATSATPFVVPPPGARRAKTWSILSLLSASPSQQRGPFRRPPSTSTRFVARVQRGCWLLEGERLQHAARPRMATSAVPFVPPPAAPKLGPSPRSRRRRPRGSANLFDGRQVRGL